MAGPTPHRRIKWFDSIGRGNPATNSMTKQFFLFGAPALVITAFVTLAAGAPEISVGYPSSTLVAWGSNSRNQSSIPGGLTEVMAIAAGSLHTLALRSNGTVVAWGYNDALQTNVPAGLTGVRAVAASNRHNLALRNDGTVVAWGSNSSGESSVPLGLADVQAIAAGTAHSVALKSDGTVVAWGRNDQGQAHVPAGLTGVTAIAAGFSHTVALKGDGTVVIWGGELDRTTRPAGLSGVRAVGAGFNYTAAIQNDGTVVVWGIGSNIPTNVPAGLAGVQNIIAANQSIIALKNDGTAVAWGRGSNGSTNLPAGLTGIQAVAAGADFGVALLESTVTFALQATGTSSAEKTFTVKNTGDGPLRVLSVDVIGAQPADFIVNTDGMLSTVPAGNGQTTFRVRFRPETAGTRNATLQILNNDSDEGAYRIPLAGTGWTPKITVYTGANTDDENERIDNFGTYTFAKGHPIQIFTIKNFGAHEVTGLKVVQSGINPDSFIVSGPESPTLPPGGTTSFTVGFRASGEGTRTGVVSVSSTELGESFFRINLSASAAAPEITVAYPCCNVVAWGNNPLGLTEVPEGLTGVKAVAMGAVHGLALKYDGTVLAWGSYYRLGEPFELIPAYVPPGLTNVQAIAAAGNTSVAVRNDGTVVIWGAPLGGKDPPAGLTGVRAVAANPLSSHFLALKTDGTVIAWGGDALGQASVPAQLRDVTAIAAGEMHSLALKSDGSVVGWGHNAFGQAAGLPSSSGVQAIAAGDVWSAALKSDGTVQAWGFNYAGQTNVPAGLKNVKAIVAGPSHVVALKMDGTVVVWGGQFKDAIFPVPSGLVGVQAIAAGREQTIALVESAALTNIAFGIQIVGASTAERALVIRNTGSSPLSITSVSIIGINASDFIVNTNEMLTTVPALDGQISFGVTFRPSAVGQRIATLRVLSDDDDEGTHDIALTGTGMAGAAAVGNFHLSSLNVLPNGAFRFTTSYARRFRVLASTNLGESWSTWTVIGAATNLDAAVLEFTDPSAANYLQRFYQLREY